MNFKVNFTYSVSVGEHKDDQPFKGILETNNCLPTFLNSIFMSARKAHILYLKDLDFNCESLVFGFPTILVFLNLRFNRSSLFLGCGKSVIKLF